MKKKVEKKDNGGKEKSDEEKFDLITIISSEEKEVPEMKPPSSDFIIYDYIPESQQSVTAVKEDHVSKTAGRDH
ncbi:MAG: hypothetical protein ACTSUE_24930 [Promethearchaeota archaeon]